MKCLSVVAAFCLIAIVAGKNSIPKKKRFLVICPIKPKGFPNIDRCIFFFSIIYYSSWTWLFYFILFCSVEAETKYQVNIFDRFTMILSDNLFIISLEFHSSMKIFFLNKIRIIDF